MMKKAILLVAIVVGLGQRADAIAPTVMMFFGGTLKAPVFLTGRDTLPFDGLLDTDKTVAPADLAGRAFVSVALFWGPPNNPANNGLPLSELKPEMAWQHGRYFPRAGAKPAVLVSSRMMKVMAGTPMHSYPVPTDPSAYIWGGPLSAAAQAVAERIVK